MTDFAADDGALVYYLDKEGQKCSITLSSKRPDLALEPDEDGTWYLKLGAIAKFVVHNDSGPAVLRDKDCSSDIAPQFVWMRNGRLHNTEGGAALWADGVRQYFIHGVPFAEDEYDQIKAEQLDCVYTRNNILKFYKKGTKTLHRTGGPATICKRPGKEYRTWYENGIIHRDGDLPAHISIDANGIEHRYWFIRGRMHREIGPAIVRSNGETEYVLHNERMSQEKFLEKVGALPKGAKLKRRAAAGFSKVAWQDYLDRVEEAHYKKTIRPDPADECRRLLSKFLSVRRPERIHLIFKQLKSAAQRLSIKDQAVFDKSINNAIRRAAKAVCDFPGKEIWTEKLLLLETLAPPPPPEQNENLTIAPAETNERTTPSAASFGLIAVACLAISGLVGLVEKQQEKKHFIEV